MLGHSMDIAFLHLHNQFQSLDIPGRALAALRGYLSFIWVIGFVVISGYCIARTCERRGKKFNLIGYLTMRVTRIYPLLIGCVLITLLVEYWVQDSPFRPAVWQSGFIPSAFVAALLGMSGFYGWFASLAPSYTISYELLYYAIWGVAWFAFGRRPLTAFASASLCWLVMWFACGGPYLQATMIFIPWLIGAAVWLARDDLVRLGRVVPQPIAWLIFFVICACIAASQHEIWVHPHQPDADAIAVGKYILVGLAFALLVVSYVARPDPREHAHFDKLLGEMSYPLFVVHGPVIILAGYLLNWSGLELPFSIYLMILCAAALTAAYLLVLAIERPVMAWRRTLGGRRAGRPIVAAPTGPEQQLADQR